jgi:hypothetical protein
MVTREDITAAKLKAEKDRLIRQAKMSAVAEWTGFAVSKLAGVGALTTGVLELASSNFHPITFLAPESVLTVGLALLVGKQVITVIATLFDVSK